MGKKSTPNAPDYIGAAEATAESSRELATANTTANRPTQNTPWGTSSWESAAGIDPSTGLPVTNWTQNLVLSGQQQEALDSQMAVQAGRSDLAEGLIGRAGAELQNPMDWNGMPKPAAAPDVPDFYGKNLPGMGTAPNPASGQNQFDYASNYKKLQEYGATPAQSTYQNPDTSKLGAWGSDPQSGLREFGSGMQQDKLGAYGQGLQQDKLGAWGGDPQANLGEYGKGMQQDTLGAWGEGMDPETLGAYGQGMQQDKLSAFGQGPQTEDYTNWGSGPQAQGYQQMGAQTEFGQPTTQAQEQTFQQELRNPTQALDATGGFQQRFADQQFERQMSLMAPQHKQASEALEVRLRNSGLNPGDAAYDQQLQNLRTQQGEEVNRLTADSVRFGTDQQQAQFGREFQTRQQQQNEASQQGNFSNNASQMRGNQQMALQNMQYQQAQGRGQFANDARQQISNEQLAAGGQQFNQQLQAANYQDSQRGQQLGEDLAVSGYQNSLRGQQANENLQASEYQNAMRGQQATERMAQSNYQNAMRGQQANENLDASDYANNMRGQQFTENLGTANYQNAMRGQQGAENLQQSEYQNAMRGQQANENIMASNQMDTQRGQQYGENLSTSNYQNTMRGQQFDEGLASANYQNDIADRTYNQGMETSNYQNALRDQQFAELNTLQDQSGAAGQGQFDRELAAAKYQDQQREQLSREQLAMGGQGFQQQMQAANYQNTLRQQAITEEMQRRGLSINEMNALLSGQQVAMPGMPDFNQATMGQAADYLGAANMQGNFDQASFATNASMANAAMSAAGGMMPSDIRLKDNIKVIGKYKGLDLVTWTWNGLLGLVGNSVGVIAQQVANVYPEAVTVMDNGYMAVYYDKLAELEGV